ncbi:hemolymph lipopolysaccharide-binding protein-like [Prorops nasuta]|uniref:hemolymph lipopolysaccharide-binding protein-like n=1 Tax=Prorops nasuta TaxID=863751 RepID=UPI0034CD3F35
MRAILLASILLEVVLVWSTPLLSTSSYESNVEADPSITGVSQTCNCSRNDMNGFPWPGHVMAPQLHNLVVHGMACTCNIAKRTLATRDDYHYKPGIGAHKLHTRAAIWNDARKLCNEEGAHLAVINSIAEAQVLQDMLKNTGSIIGAAYPDEALLGIHDLYTEGDWVTVLGESLGKTGYTVWSDKWGGQPDNGGGKQNCGALLKDGGMDDVACSVAFPFFCELPALQFF